MSRLCGPNTSGPMFVLVVRWWVIVVLSISLPRTWPISTIIRGHIDQRRLLRRKRSCASRSWWPVWCPCVHLRRRKRPHGRLITIRVDVRVKSVSWTGLTVWNNVVSIPRPSESVRTLRSLSYSLRVRIRVGIILRVGAVGVSQILVTSRGVWIGIWVWLLLLLDGRGMGGNGDRWVVVGCKWVRAIRIVRSGLLRGRGGMIYARTFRTARKQATGGCTHKMFHGVGVHTEHLRPQGIGKWVAG